MMIAPCTFIDEYKNCTYAQLIKVRNELLEEILGFEADEKRGLREGEEWSIHPSPQVRYQMNQEYLQELLKLMAEKYEEDTVMVDETKDDEQLVFIRNIIWSEGVYFGEPSAFTKAANKMLNKLIKNGNAEAMNLKGAMYYEGQGVEQDQKKAVNWYKKAADAGCSIAMSNLGYAYFYGNGTAVNMQLAYKYFSMAVQRGEWDAINKLGDMYREGLYVPKDEKMAFKLYDQCYGTVPHDATNDAYPACLVRIAECLYKGIGITVNHIAAYNLLKEAENILNIQIEDGNFYAKLCVDRVVKDIKEVEDLQEEINRDLQILKAMDSEVE